MPSLRLPAAAMLLATLLQRAAAACDPPCLNGGTCVESSGWAWCTCAAGFSGYACEITICAPSLLCYNGGACAAGNTGCTCPEHYSGSGCQKYTAPPAPFPAWAVAVIVVGSFLLVVAVVGVACLIHRERRGKPVFMRLDDVIEYERKKRAEAAAAGIIMVDIKAGGLLAGGGEDH